MTPERAEFTPSYDPSFVKLSDYEFFIEKNNELQVKCQEMSTDIQPVASTRQSMEQS